MGAAEAPLLATARNGRELVFVGNGSWLAVQGRALEGSVDAALAELAAAPTESARFDLSGVRGFDTLGAVVLDRIIQALEKDGVRFQIVGLERRFRPLLDDIVKGSHENPPRTRHVNAVIGSIQLVGRTTVAMAQDGLALLSFIGTAMSALLRVVVRPHTFRFTSMIYHLERTGLRAVPIVALITFLIGCIIAQQGIFHFRKFGATTMSTT